MTKKEFLTKVVDLGGELGEYAEGELVKMADAAEKRKGKATKKATENQPLVDEIVANILGADPMTASDVAAAIGVSTQKASALLKTGVAQGTVTVADGKGKKGKCKVYTLA